MSEIHADDYQTLAKAGVTQIEQITVTPVYPDGRIGGAQEQERYVAVTSSRASLTAAETRRVRLAVIRLANVTTDIITVKTTGVRP